VSKPPLSRDELCDIIDLSLWVGQLLLQHGADAERVEETIHRFGTALGCDWVDVLVSPNVIAITTTSGEEFRTKIRRVLNIGVNMYMISAMNRLSRRVTAGELDRFQARSEIVRINNTPPQYNRWSVVLMVGLACGAFSQLFGGDGPVFVVTFVASSIAMVVRQELTRHHFNPLLVVIATAFVAGVIASSAVHWHLGAQPELALAASVLLLVPGVQLINSAEDLIKGHSVIGLTRGLVGGLVSLAIALGLALAFQLAGVRGL
jgi:uncharacterized membrane protein YjjP (DUF1212 family)